METRIKRYTQLQEKCDHLPAGKLEKPQNQENTDLTEQSPIMEAMSLPCEAQQTTHQHDFPATNSTHKMKNGT